MSKLETLKAGLGKMANAGGKALESAKNSADALGRIPLIRRLRNGIANIFMTPVDLTMGVASQTREVVKNTLVEPTKEAAVDVAKSRWRLMWDVPKSLVTGPLNAAWMALSPLGRFLQGAWRTTGHVAKVVPLLATLHLGEAKDQLISAPRAAIQNLLQDPMPKLKNAPEFAKQVAKPVTTFLDAEWKFAAGIGNALKHAGQGLAGAINIPKAGLANVRSGWQNREQAANDGDYREQAANDGDYGKKGELKNQAENEQPEPQQAAAA